MNWRKLAPVLRVLWRRRAGTMNWRNPIRVIGLLGWPVILVVTWALWQGLKMAALLSWVGLQTIRFFAELPASMILFLVGSGASVWTFLYRPFPVLESDPLLDLVEYHHTPRFYEAVMLWYYLSPGVAVVLTGSIAVSVWKVWFESPKPGSDCAWQAPGVAPRSRAGRARNRGGRGSSPGRGP